MLQWGQLDSRTAFSPIRPALWQTLPLTQDLPRPDALLEGVDLLRGLRAWRGFGWFALVGGALILLSLALPARPGEQGLKVLGALILTAFAAESLYHARRSLALRREALSKGLPVTGSIVRHGKRLNLFSSSPYITISAVFWLPDREQTAFGILWQRGALRDLPLGSRILGLWLPDTGRIWLPLEAGIRLDAEPLELNDCSLVIPEPDQDPEQDPNHVSDHRTTHEESSSWNA